MAAVQEAGGFAAQLSDIEEISAFHGDNYEVLVHRFFRKDRAVMFDLAAKLALVATTDERLTAAVEATGKSPQYIVDEALSEYLSRLEARSAAGQ